jgi:iron-sulfur cluster repair protein YtfE (RIC family)
MSACRNVSASSSATSRRCGHTACNVRRTVLVTLGKPRAPDDLVELLAACHERIRGFLTLAHRLAEALEAPLSDIRATAGHIRRYFAESLPQHIADEDAVVSPHLAGRTPALDAALATMSADHAEHAAAVGRLVALAAAIEHEPRQIAAVADDLATAATALRALLVPHLALEEQTIFPALRALPQVELEALRAAMRERRRNALSAADRHGQVEVTLQQPRSPGAVTES